MSLTWRADPDDNCPDPPRFERPGLDGEDDGDGFPFELAIVVVPMPRRSHAVESMLAGPARWVTMAIPGIAPRLRC